MSFLVDSVTYIVGEVNAELTCGGRNLNPHASQVSISSNYETRMGPLSCVVYRKVEAVGC